MSQNENQTTTSSTPPAGRPAEGRGRGGLFFGGTLGLALVAAAALLAFRATGEGARGPLGHGAFFHGPLGGACSAADAEKHVTRMVGWLVDDLKGTPEQEKKLAEIATAAVRDLAPIRTELHENHEKVVALLSAESVDRAALEALRARQMELATSASTRLTTAVADAADVLTPAQRATLAARLKARWG